MDLDVDGMLDLQGRSVGGWRCVSSYANKVGTGSTRRNAAVSAACEHKRSTRRLLPNGRADEKREQASPKKASCPIMYL